jgi:hypothetical protein
MQPALVGGLIIGLGSSIPILESANLCCCLWSLVGGAVAAWMLIRRSEVLPITSGDGAMVGLLAGLVGSGTSLVLSVPLRLLMWSSTVERVRAMADNYPDAAARATMLQMARLLEESPVLFALLVWLLFAVIGTAAASLGGVIGVAFFEKRKGQPPSPPPQSSLPLDWGAVAPPDAPR